MIVLACGSRDYRDLATVRGALVSAGIVAADIGEDVHLIHGDCRGADRLASHTASVLRWDVTAYPADWSRGKRAGPERNRKMLDAGPSLVLAFGRGKGTDGVVSEAVRRGIRVRRYP